MILPLLKSRRKETIENTLNHVEASGSSGLFPRTTHLYKADKKILDIICEKLKTDASYINPSVQHDASDLGLSYKIVTERNGHSINYDGLCLRITKIIEPGEIDAIDLSSIDLVNKEECDTQNNFVKIIRAVDPNVDAMMLPINYLTAGEINWDAFGIEITGNPVIKTIIKDPVKINVGNIISSDLVPATILYLGDESQIHQMMAHDFFMSMEVDVFVHFFYLKHNELLVGRTEMDGCFSSVLLPLIKFRTKRAAWNKLKKIMINLYHTSSLEKKGRELLKELVSLVGEHVAFINEPKTLWVGNEEQDTAEYVPMRVRGFFEASLENGKIKMPVLKVTNKIYQFDVDQLDQELEAIDECSLEMYPKGRDLLVAYQTEFTMNALVIAIVAIVLSVLAIGVTIVI